FLLAQLYEADENWPEAKKHFLALLATKDGDTPAHLAYYIRALLSPRHRDMDEAVVWLGRLKRNYPDSPSTVEAEARVLVEQKDGARAAHLLREFAIKQYAAKKEPAVLGAVALLLENLKQAADAEKLFRQYVAETATTKPENAQVLA